MNPKRETLLGIFLILFFLGSLFLIPLLNQKTEIDFSGERSLPSLQFPMKKKFKVITHTKKNLGSVSLEEILGTHSKLLVNFWASWCPPCIEEIPSLDYLNRLLQTPHPYPKNVSPPILVTFSADQNVSEVNRLFKTLESPPSFIVLHDPEGELATQLGTTKFPETYLITKEGTVEKKWLGPQNWLSLAVIKNLLPNSLH